MYRFAAILLWALPTFVYAQKTPCDCFVKGTVRDNATKQPLAGALVYLKETRQSATADANGQYKITNVCQGKYTLVCRIVGYRDTDQVINLAHGAEENLQLSESEIHLNDVEIVAQKTPTLLSQPVQAISGDALAQTRGQSLADALATLTGVTMLQTGASIAKPVIAGLHSNRVLIMNNGVRQEAQQWGSEHAPEIDAFVAQKLVVVKGANSVQYGSDAIGGIILVEPNALPIGASLGGEVNLVGFSNGRQGVASATLEGGLGKWRGFGWRAQGTLKRAGNLKTPNYFLDNTGLSEQNYSLAMGYKRQRFGVEAFHSRFETNIGIFSGAHIGSVSDLQRVFDNGEPFVKSDFSYRIGRPNQLVSHSLYKVKAFYGFKNNNRLTLTFARQYNRRAEYDLHRPLNDARAALNLPELLFRITTLSTDLTLEHAPIAKKITGQVGLSGLYQYNFMDGRPLIPDFELFNVGAFVVERLVQKKWEFEAGLRFDARQLLAYRFVNRVRNDVRLPFRSWSGTLGAVRRFSDALSVRLNVGRAWRAPNVNELFSAGVHHGAAAYEEGNDKLGVENAINLIGNVDYQTKKLSINLSLYHNSIQNYIYFKPQPAPILTVRGAFPYFKATQTDATFSGFDLTTNWAFSPRLTHISKLAYLYARDQTNSDYLVLIPANRWENTLKLDLGNAKRFGTKRLTDQWFSVTNLWVARQENVPPNSDFVPPPPAYSLWNAALHVKFALKPTSGEATTKPSYITLQLAVNNVFDLRYRDYLNRFRYFSDEIGRNLSLKMRLVF